MTTDGPLPAHRALKCRAATVTSRSGSSVVAVVPPEVIAVVCRVLAFVDDAGSAPDVHPDSPSPSTTTATAANRLVLCPFGVPILISLARARGVLRPLR